MHYISVAEVAEHAGCSVSTVRRIARKHGIGRTVGRSYVFNSGERDRIASLVLPVGCPLFTAGNSGFVDRRKKLSGK